MITRNLVNRTFKRNSISKLIGSVLGVAEPVIEWVSHLDGLTQYWQLQGEVIATVGSEITFYTVNLMASGYQQSLTNGSGSVYIHGNGNIYCRKGGDTSGTISIDDGPFSTNPKFPYDGAIHKVVAKVSNEFTITELAASFDSGDNPRYLMNGSAYGFSVSDDSGVYYELPLTNKAQGVTQLATVGNINATMVNYTEDVWEQLPVATGVFGARLNGTSQQWNLSAPISTSEGDYFAFDFSISADAGTFGDYKRILGSDSDYGVRLGVRSGGTTGSFELVRVVGTLDGEGIVNSSGIPNDRTLKAITVTPDKAGDVIAIGGLATVVGRSFAGVVANFRHYNSDGVLLHEILLTNKEQGATQLGTVGGINATMTDFNENTWEELYSAS